jgi:hypothetical protein
MADDDKLEPNDDPWAGLEAEGLPDLNEGFAFSFDEEPAQAAENGEEGIGEPFAAFEEPLAEAAGRGEASFEPPSGDVEELVASDSLSLPEGLAELLSGSTVGAAGDATAGSDELVGESVSDDDAVGDWLGEPDGDPSALGISALPDDGPADPDVGAQAAASLSVFSSDDDSDDASGIDPTGDLIGEQSTVQIGTGTSGIASPSSIEAFGSDAGSEEDGDPFAALGSDDEEADPWATLNADGPESSASDEEGMPAFAESGDDASAAESVPEPEVESFAFAAADEPDGEAETIGLATAAASSAPPAAKKKASKQLPPRKKKPSMVGQLVGVVVGGLMSFPIVLGILWWGLGRDPLQVAPLVPDSLGFLLPAKLRSGDQLIAFGGTASGLDAVLGAAAGGGSDLPADEELAMNDEPEPVLPADDPVDPLDRPSTDLAVADPLPADGDDDDDPLMALLKEDTAAPVDPGPPPVPEPEPLDTVSLEAAAEQALAALAAVKAVEDLNDPVGRKLIVNCYRSLAAYAQELAMLERVAADTGRPLSELPASAGDVHRGISDRPELFEPLARLTRDWLAFKKRPSDGVLAPATFVAARQVGPYWRTEVEVGSRPLVVLSRSEPAAVPGETVLVTGLVVDEGVLWATDVRPAKRVDPFGI